ncbi:MAG TPA: hypothetical protein VI542_14915 [Candidatus Tectomicrobia bacterium]
MHKSVLGSIVLVVLLVSSGLLIGDASAAERACPIRIGALTESWCRITADVVAPAVAHQHATGLFELVDPLAALPLVVIFFCTQRSFLEGLTLTGINATMLLIIVGMSSYVLVRIKRETREITHSIATLNAGRLQVFCDL